MWLTSLLGPVGNIVSTWLEGKQKIQEATISKEVTQLTNEANWDNIQAEASKSSWKDEWLTILISIPMILSFIPGMGDVVREGFTTLSNCPEWYQYLIGVVFAASFGIKKVTDIFASKRR
ncbi:hypothetical protein D3C71_806700 [compost metagenome]